MKRFKVRQIIIRASPEQVFSYIDKIGNTGMHMMKSSLPRNKQLKEDGQSKVHQHQWLTLDTGITALDRHLYALIALMKASTTWDNFMRSVERSFPPFDSLFRKGQ